MSDTPNILSASVINNHANLSDMHFKSIIEDTPRVLFGIWSVNTRIERKVRDQFRLLFETFANRTSDHNGKADARICNLGEFLEKPEYFPDCKVVYTFVIGAAKNQTRAPTEIVMETSRPLLIKSNKHITGKDKNNKDMTLLNIKENLEGGKSQTFFYLAQEVLHHFDYVAKCDSDSVLDLLVMFDFLDNNLPRPPHNLGIIVGAPYNKQWWKTNSKLNEDTIRYKRNAEESYLQDRYGNNNMKDIFHIYPRGEFYMLSADLVHVVLNEVRSGNYMEYSVGVEDHDIGTMAHHSLNPIHFIYLSSMDKMFWDHPVKIKRKNEGDWGIKWKTAIDKLKGSPNATLESFDHFPDTGAQSLVIDWCKEVPLNCNQYYTVDSFEVNEKKVDAVSSKRLYDLRYETSKTECLSAKVTTSGGSCLESNELSPFVYKNFTQLIPKGQFKPSRRIWNVLRELVDEEKVKSISEFGAGVGVYRGVLMEHSPHLSYMACDGAGNIDEFTEGAVSFCDLSIPLELSESEWVLSFDVGNKIPRLFEATVIRNLHHHNCKGIILGWDIPHAEKPNMDNLHTNAYIVSLFEKLGYRYDKKLANEFRNEEKTRIEKSFMAFRRINPTC